MRSRPASCWSFFRLSYFIKRRHSTVAPARRCFPPGFHRASPLLFAQKLTMQAGGNMMGSGHVQEDLVSVVDQAKLLGTIPHNNTAEDTADPPAGEKRGAGNTLVIQQRKFRTPSPLYGANCDEDSEAESFRNGRTEEVDRDTRARALAWCRDFLSGSWKTLQEEDFQVSIVR